MSFARNRARPATALPTTLAVLLVGVASRQAASPTAQAQARITSHEPEAEPLAPAEGAFSAPAAAAITRWQEE